LQLFGIQLYYLMQSRCSLSPSCDSTLLLQAVQMSTITLLRFSPAAWRGLDDHYHPPVIQLCCLMWSRCPPSPPCDPKQYGKTFSAVFSTSRLITPKIQCQHFLMPFLINLARLSAVVRCGIFEDRLWWMVHRFTRPMRYSYAYHSWLLLVRRLTGDSFNPSTESLLSLGICTISVKLEYIDKNVHNFVLLARMGIAGMRCYVPRLQKRM